MQGVQYPSPRKGNVGRSTQFVTQRSNRRDGKVTKTSHRNATASEVKSNFKSAKEIHEEANRVLLNRELGLSHIDEGQIGGFNDDGYLGDDGMREGYDADVEAEEEDDVYDGSCLENTRPEDVLEAVDDILGRQNALSDVPLRFGMRRKKRSYTENKKNTQINWDKFIRTLTGELASKKNRGCQPCDCTGTIMLPAVSFRGICHFLYHFKFT
jgi:hypothetical protein